MTYAMMAKEMVDKVTDMFNHAKKVRSLAKNTFGSTFTGNYNHEANKENVILSSI